MEIRVLGPLEVVDDQGSTVPVPGPRLQRLLATLVVRCGEVVVDDRLLELLWDGDAPARPSNALQRHVSTLRGLFPDAAMLQRRSGGYTLVVDRDVIDAYRFERMVGLGRSALLSGDATTASSVLNDALELWRGDALVDMTYQEFAQAEIARLSELRIAATEARIDADLELGRHASLVGELEQLVLEHPLREHLRGQLMLALSRSGRQAEALRAFQTTRALLGEELGLEPSHELRALETAIVRQDVEIVGFSPQEGSRRHDNLRPSLTPLIGRGEAVDVVTGLLPTHRLVTLVGPGGVGKTRLATEVARRALEAGAEEVWLVEFGDVSGLQGVLCAIAAALDLPHCDDEDQALSRATDRLRHHGAVLLFDNCEHVLPFVAPIAQELLELNPKLHIVATSRESLGVPSEVLWPVQPLNVDAAVDLFIERGLAADPTSRLDDGSRDRADLLRAICRQLDGLPLAIELAAGRLRSMPLSELARGLESRFRLLNRGSRTALPRHQTLQSVVDWSYELLSHPERRVFERLSAFVGGCSMAAARAVCTDDAISTEDVADIVTRLADKSLVTIEEDELAGHARCRMLQTLAEYGRERLVASGDAARVQASHAAYYADLAVWSMAALRGEDQRSWIRVVSANLGNLRSALDDAVERHDAETAQRIAGSLGWFWWFTGRADDGAAWLSLASSVGDAREPLTRARVLAWTVFSRDPGFVLWPEPNLRRVLPSRPDHRVVDGFCEQAIALYGQDPRPDELPGVLAALAVAYSTRGDHARACELLLEAEHVLDESRPAPWAVAMHAYVAGRRAFVENRYTEAEQELRTSISLFGSIGAEVYAAFAGRYVGRARAMCGDYTGSIAVFESALIAARKVELPAFANALLIDLSDVVASTGDFQRARELLQLPLETARDHGSTSAMSELLTALALLDWRAGKRDDAERSATQALGCAEACGDSPAAAQALAILGLAAEWRQDTTEARTRYEALLARSSGPRHAALGLEGLAGVSMLECDAATAARLLGAADALRRCDGRANGRGYSLGGRADVKTLLTTAAGALGVEAMNEAFAAGAADPDLTLMAVGRPAAAFSTRP